MALVSAPRAPRRGPLAVALAVLLLALLVPARSTGAPIGQTVAPADLGAPPVPAPSAPQLSALALPLLLAAVAVLLAILVATQFRRETATKPPPLVKGPPPAAPVAAPAPAVAAADALTPLSVYFGSQTGTAEGYAKQLAKLATTHGFRGKALDLESFNPEALTSGGLAVFVMATYGEGEATDNSVDFTRWLKAAPPGCLAGLRFTVFGLGNRQYEHYNAMGKLANARLAELGGARAYRHGEGDDEGNMEEDWLEWSEGGLWEALRAASGGGGGGAAQGAPPTTAATAAAVPPPWRAVTVPPPLDARALAVGHAMPPGALAAAAAAADVSARHLFLAAPVVVGASRELRQAPGVGASTRHVELELAGTGMSYATADNAFLVPDNDASAVEAAARWLGYEPDSWFALEPAAPQQGGAPPPPLPFPTPCSVRTLLARYTDLHGAPKRDLLAALAPHATRAEERERLARLGSRDGKADFAAWVTDAQRSVLEVLAAHPSVQLPLAAFVAVMPRQAYRAYTIASSALVSPSALHICASVIDAPKPGPDASRRLRGVAGSQLARLQSQDRVMLYVRPSTFHLPADASVPVILVGPGTGIAPMRAFLHERRLQRAQSAAVGETVMFFGCRRRDEDFIYRDELEGFAADGTITALHLAFSREKNEKVYVQHLIAQHGSSLWPLVIRGAHFYVCGATKMGSDVLKAFEALAESEGKMTPSASSAFVSDLKARKRYIQELWTS